MSDQEERRLADELQLAMQSDAAARLVCDTLQQEVVPWPGISQALDSWKEHHDKGAWADGEAQAVCRAIAAHVAKGGSLAWPVWPFFERWTHIQDQLAQVDQ